MLKQKGCNGCGLTLPSEAFNARMKRGKRTLRSRCRECERDERLRNLYGISSADYDRMLEEQDGVCAVCGGNATTHNHTEGLVVDHCHETGKVRGLLCDWCNRAEGLLRSSPENALALYHYLMES